jgi:hypothetical protein
VTGYLIYLIIRRALAGGNPNRYPVTTATGAFYFSHEREVVYKIKICKIAASGVKAYNL